MATTAPEESGSPEGEAPEWPDEAVESAMIAEARDREGEAAPVRPRGTVPAEEPDDPGSPLPALEALVAQIPADVRETLDELFRARFTAVKRVSKAALKD